MSCKFLVSSTILSVLLCCSSLLSLCTSQYSVASLDSMLENFALRALTTRRGTHTGALYRAVLPANLTGIEVSIVRLTGRSLWSNGAKFSNIHIPPRTLSFPPVRRLAIMYQDLGNWSDSYYNVPGYTLITSVVGFRVFDVTNMRRNRDVVREIGVRTQKPIEVEFPDLDADPDEKTASKARCVSFTRANTEFHTNPVRLPGVCSVSSQGHFAVVVPLVKTKRKKNKNDSRWFWLMGLAVGLGLVGFVGYMAVAGIRVLRSKKIQVMEREADDGEVFHNRWVGGSKMPSATVTRTQPETGLESGSD